MLRVGGTVFQIEDVVTDERGAPQEFVLRHYETGERKRATPDRFAAMRPGIEYFVIQPSDRTRTLVELLADSDQQKKMLNRLPLNGKSRAQIDATVTRIKWLDALHSAGYFNFNASQLWVPDLMRIAKENDLPIVERETLADWEAKKGGSAIIPRYDLRGGAGRPRTDARAEDILAQTICRAKKGELITLSAQAVHSEMMYQINQKNASFEKGVAYIAAPSIRTVERRFNSSVSQFEKDVQKYGIKAAKRMHKATGARPSAEFVGAISEFDDLDTKVFAIDETTRLPWGRPFITAGVDVHSDGYPVGRSFGKEPRSAVSAVDAVVHSIEPKQVVLLGSDGLPLPWAARGLVGILTFDNALYNNERIVSLGVDLFDLCWSRSRTPTNKSSIEFFNHEAMAFFRSLPGWRGPKDDKEAIKEGLATALFSVERMRVAFDRWMLGSFIHQPMKDGLTRHQKYVDEGRTSLRAPLPLDVRRLRLLKMRRFPDPVTWSRSGVRIMGLTYQDVALYECWINRAGGSLRVDARIDDADIGQIYVDLPGTTLTFELKCLEERYAHGLTLYQHQLVRKLCAQKKQTNPSLVQMYAARHDLTVMVEQWKVSGKVRERKRAVRAGEIGSKKGGTPPVTEAVHDAEIGCCELDAVEMERGHEGWDMPVHD